MEKISILFSSFPDFSGNPKALYEYINANFYNKFNLFWVVHSDKSIPLLENNNLNVVLFKSQSYEKLIDSIDIIFDTNRIFIF